MESSFIKFFVVAILVLGGFFTLIGLLINSAGEDYAEEAKAARQQRQQYISNAMQMQQLAQQQMLNHNRMMEQAIQEAEYGYGYEQYPAGEQVAEPGYGHYDR